MTSPAKHPATTIPAETVAEIAYRVYLARLEPPLTRAFLRVLVDMEMVKV